MKVINKHTKVIYDAEQFIMGQQAPSAIIWHGDLRPRDMSFGFVYTANGVVNVLSGDWIIGGFPGDGQHPPGCHQCISDQRFKDCYESIIDTLAVSETKKHTYYVSY